MPSLPAKQFTRVGKTGEKLEFTSRIYVDSQGQFSFSVPEEMIETIRAMGGRAAGVPTNVKAVFSRGANRITCGSYAAGEKFLYAAMDEHLSVSTVREDVLVYRYFSEMAYWKTEDGRIFPNGAEHSGDGRWNRSNLSYVEDREKREDRYTIGFAAFALVKETVTRGPVSKVRWIRWRENGITDDPRMLLNSFNHIGIDEEHLSDWWTVVPYEPRAAKFFYDVMISLCRIDDRLSSFFTDKAKVTAAIDSGSAFKLTA